MLLVTGCAGDAQTQTDAERPDDPGTVTATLGPDQGPLATTDSRDGAIARDVRITETVARDLAVPWGLAFLPDGSALVTQRDTGTVSRVNDGNVTQVGRIAETVPTSEGGLLGVAVSPDFATDQLIFVYVTTADDNRVLSMTYDGSAISAVRPILTGIPSGSIHDGGRLAFGPDGFLYVSTGEIGNRDLARDRSEPRRQDPSHHQVRRAGSGKP